MSEGAYGATVEERPLADGWPLSYEPKDLR
jgi:hypothetical protein